MYKKILSIFMAIVFILTSLTSTALASNEMVYYNLNDDSVIDLARDLGDVYIDPEGNSNTVEYIDNGNTLEIMVYVNGVLDNKATLNKKTYSVRLEDYNTKNSLPKITEYNKDDLFTILEYNGINPLSLPVTSSYKNYGTKNTDYVYKGSVLKGSVYYRAYEPSTSNRYNQKVVNFSRGDLVSLLIAALSGFVSGGITIPMLIALGFPIASGKLTDGVSKTVSYTTFSVGAKVSFDNILTANVNESYNKVIVAADNLNGDVVYSYEYYGYDIAESHISTAVSNGAIAFSDKYITGKNPNLSLPITTLPYYAY